MQFGRSLQSPLPSPGKRYTRPQLGAHAGLVGLTNLPYAPLTAFALRSACRHFLGASGSLFVTNRRPERRSIEE